MKVAIYLGIALLGILKAQEARAPETPGNLGAAILNELKADLDAAQAGDFSDLQIEDITVSVSGQAELSDFKFTQTRRYLTLEHSDLNFFLAELYDGQGHQAAEFRSVGGGNPQIKIPMNSFGPKPVFINLKDGDFKVIKTYRLIKEAVFSSKE